MAAERLRKLSRNSKKIFKIWNKSSGKVEHRNILLIGRARTGKSTITSSLINPVDLPDEMTRRPGTREPQLQAFHLAEDGHEASRNSCLVITHCETASQTLRDKLRKKLVEDVNFTKIAPFFKLSIFFFGSINRDDCECGHENVCCINTTQLVAVVIN